MLSGAVLTMTKRVCRAHIVRSMVTFSPILWLCWSWDTSDSFLFSPSIVTSVNTWFSCSPLPAPHPFPPSYTLLLPGALLPLAYPLLRWPLSVWSCTLVHFCPQSGMPILLPCNLTRTVPVHLLGINSGVASSVSQPCMIISHLDSQNTARMS